MNTSPRMTRLRLQWQGLPRRQRLLAAVAGGVVAGALVWLTVLGPALSTLRDAPAQHQALDAQLQQMRGLQAQAQAMRSLPRMGRDEAQLALQASVSSRLGTGARLAISGDAATLTLAGVRADALAQWLAQARTDARAVPSEAHLSRNPNGLWDGTLVVALPPR